MHFTKYLHHQNSHKTRRRWVLLKKSSCANVERRTSSDEQCILQNICITKIRSKHVEDGFYSKKVVARMSSDERRASKMDHASSFSYICCSSFVVRCSTFAHLSIHLLNQSSRISQQKDVEYRFWKIELVARTSSGERRTTKNGS